MSPGRMALLKFAKYNDNSRFTAGPAQRDRRIMGRSQSAATENVCYYILHPE